jgi:DNA-binding NtrC family response regulator
MPTPEKIVVLVVEDEPLIRIEIVDELATAGFDVLEASNTPAALAILIKNPRIQVKFTDVDMPGGPDGLALAAAVRDRWPPIKIIVTSGYRKVSALDMPAGARFFAKPYKSEQVSNSIRHMVGA